MNDLVVGRLAPEVQSQLAPSPKSIIASKMFSTQIISDSKLKKLFNSCCNMHFLSRTHKHYLANIIQTKYLVPTLIKFMWISGTEWKYIITF